MPKYREYVWLGSAAMIAIAMSSCRAPVHVQPTSHGTTPMADTIGYEFAVYYLPRAKGDPVKTAQAAARRLLPNTKILAQPAAKPTAFGVAIRLIDNVAKEYAPPGPAYLGPFAHGLTDIQSQALQKSKQALILHFGYSKDQVWTGMKDALALTLKIARETDGLIWDEETREVFTPAAWESRRIKTWTGKLPAAPDHVIVHAYRNGEYIRVISLGMAKFGLPDLVVNQCTWSDANRMTDVVNLLAQSMVEGALLSDDFQMDLDAWAVENDRVRASLVSDRRAGATGKARFDLKPALRKEGDPRNRILEIRCDRYDGPDVHARQEQMISELFGATDSVTAVKRTGELEAASRKAKAELPALRKAFVKGLAPSEYIQVKAPFKTPDNGIEWMWVEVTSWRGTTIKGLLRNDPVNVPNLHSGQIVTVSQVDVFDYIHTFPDGTSTGNTTGRIIERQAEGG